MILSEEKISGIKEKIQEDGFAVVADIFDDETINKILAEIPSGNLSSSFRQTKDLFAIRRFLHEVETAPQIIFLKSFIDLIISIFGEGFFAVKSIYFDKPAESNWFVAYHQDLKISVDKKMDADGFVNWIYQNEQYSVQPPREILENNFTVRIHLDDTDENNGALKVISGSHLLGIQRPEKIDLKNSQEHICKVGKGGIMIMKPLLLHASGKTTNDRKRRVVHIEFSRSTLPDGLKWSEKIFMPAAPSVS